MSAGPWIAVLLVGTTDGVWATCRPILIRHAQCVAHRTRTAPSTTSECETGFGGLVEHCLKLEAELLDEGASPPLPPATGNSPVAMEVYGLAVDPDLLRVANQVMSAVVASGAARQARISSAGRTAARQAELIRVGNPHAATSATGHAVGLAVDIAVTGWKRWAEVERVARSVVVQGERGMRRFKLIAERDHGVVHIQADGESEYYAQEIRRRSARLYRAGVLGSPWEQPTFPPLHLFRDWPAHAMTPTRKR